MIAPVPVPVLQQATADGARRAADEVLADAVFDRPGPGLLEQARDWVTDRIGDVLDALAGTAGGGLVGWSLLGLLGVAAVLLAVRFTRGVQADPRSGGGALEGPLRPAVDWLAEAGRREAAGDWRGGLRSRYRALVADLAARGLVEEVPGRTAGEYREQVASSAPAAAPAFDGATALFEGAWYGSRPVAAAEAARFRDLTERVLAGDRSA